MKKRNGKANIFKLNEATSIAIHASIYMAQNIDKFVGATEISQKLSASRDHVEKVMQRLSKADLITTKRGPKGGFKLAKESGEIKLLDIFEAIEGEIAKDIFCPLGESFCGGKRCVMGTLFSSLQNQAIQFMDKKNLQELINEE